MVRRRYGALLVAAIPFVVSLVIASVALASPAAAPVTPHAVDGPYANCLTCHGSGGMKPVPASHAGWTNDTCLGCHPPASAPAAPTAAPEPTEPAAPVVTPTPEASPAPGATPTPTPPATPSPAPAPPASTPPSAPAGKNDQCLGCHQNQALAFTLPSGEQVSAYVDPERFAASIHGAIDIACTDCHADITGFPHRERTATNTREYTMSMRDACQKCHSANYRMAQDSVHTTILRDGNLAAPVCSDCHGSHYIEAPEQPRQHYSQTCSSCHSAIYDEYVASVHGSSLLGNGNPDVPTCTDCHGVHTIPDPRTAEFRIESPELCARCHADDELMEQYGLSSRVYHTYRSEFHGATATIYKTRWPSIWCYQAVCTDCHGVHEIRPAGDPASLVHEANLPQTCGQCHPGAGPNFAGAWIGHYEPSPENAPLVYYVTLFYQIMIPLVVVGCVGFIGLDVIRRVLNFVQSGER